MAEKQAEKQAEKTPEQIREEIYNECRKGVLELADPIQDGETVYDKLEYDFSAMKGLEIVRAIDDGSGTFRRNSSNFRLSDEQALHLFAAAAMKAMGPGKLDAKDIIERMGAADSIQAVQAAALFFNISSQGAPKTTGKK